MVIDLGSMADDKDSVTVHIETPVESKDSLSIQLTGDSDGSGASLETTSAEGEAPVPDTAHEAGDIVFGDESVAEILVRKSAAEREQVDDEQIFNDLLLHFKRQPKLVHRKISVQTGQDLVVEPMDVKRLTELVHRAMECVAAFPSENQESKPLLDEALDENHCNYSKAWLRPLVFDRRVILHAAQGERSDADDSHTLERMSLQRHITDQVETQSWPQSYKQKNRPYSSDRLHELHRSAFAPSRTHALTNNATSRFGVPVLSYVTDKMGRKIPGVYIGVDHTEGRCTGATGPPREWGFVQASQVYRIVENYPLNSLHEESMKFTIEHRMASHPVMQPRFDHDDTTFESHVVTLGEPLAIVGFVIHGELGEANSVTVRDVTPAASATCFKRHRTVVLAPDALSEILGAYIPSQMDVLGHQPEVWTDCYNLGMVDECFGRFKLSFDALTADVIARLRAVITRNVVDLIDKVLSRRERTERRLQKAALAVPSRIRSRGCRFLDNRIVHDCLGGVVEDDPIAAMIRLNQVPDHGDECLLMLGCSQTPAADDSQVPSDSQHLANPARDKFLADISHMHPGLANSDWTRVLERAEQAMALSLRDFRSSLTQEHSEGIRQRQLAAARRGRLLRTKLREETVMDVDVTDLGSDFVLRNEESGESGDFVQNEYGSTLDISFYSHAARAKMDDDRADKGIPNPSKMPEFSTTALRRIADMFVVMMNPNKLNFTMSPVDLVRAVYDVSSMFDEMETYLVFVTDYVRSRVGPTSTAEEKSVLIAEAKGRFNEEIGRDTDVKTQRHASAIIARLLIELETHRPKHAFRQIIAKSGRKTIGSNLDTQYEYYSDENKLTFLVQLASDTSNLGKEGRLLDSYQADDLKAVTARVAEYVDRYRGKPDIAAAYTAAEEADKRQEIVQRVILMDRTPHGFEAAATLGDEARVSVEQLSEKAGSVRGDYMKLLSVQSAAEVQLHRDVMRLLKHIHDNVSTALALEQVTDSKNNYDPYKYGAVSWRNNSEEASGAWRCVPDQETCIVNTFVDMRGTTELLSSIRECTMIRKLLSANHSFLNVSTRWACYTVYSADMAPRATSCSHPAHIEPVRPAPEEKMVSVEVESVLRALHSLTSQLRNLTGQDATWEKNFTSALTDRLGKRSWGFDDGAVKKSLLGLRRLVRLLASDMRLWFNNYRFDSGHISLKNYDKTVRRREIVDVTRDITDPVYVNSLGVKYLVTFRPLFPALKSLGTDRLGGVSVEELASMGDHEQLLKTLLDSLDGVLLHVKEVDETKLSLAAELLIKYVDNCLRIDDLLALAPEDDGVDRRIESTIRKNMLLSAQEKSEAYVRRLLGLDDDDSDDDGDKMNDIGAKDDPVFNNDDSYYADEETRVNVSWDDDTE